MDAAVAELEDVRKQLREVADQMQRELPHEDLLYYRALNLKLLDLWQSLEKHKLLDKEQKLLAERQLYERRRLVEVRSGPKADSYHVISVGERAYILLLDPSNPWSRPLFDWVEASLRVTLRAWARIEPGALLAPSALHHFFFYSETGLMVLPSGQGSTEAMANVMEYFSATLPFIHACTCITLHSAAAGRKTKVKAVADMGHWRGFVQRTQTPETVEVYLFSRSARGPHDFITTLKAKYSEFTVVQQCESAIRGVRPANFFIRRKPVSPGEDESVGSGSKGEVIGLSMEVVSEAPEGSASDLDSQASMEGKRAAMVVWEKMLEERKSFAPCAHIVLEMQAADIGCITSCDPELI